MKVDNWFTDLAVAAANAIHRGKVGVFRSVRPGGDLFTRDTVLPVVAVRTRSGVVLRRIDVTVPVSQGNRMIGANVTFIQQNPVKQTRFAALARHGHQITWIMANGRYMTLRDAGGKRHTPGVVDGQFVSDMHEAVSV